MRFNKHFRLEGQHAFLSPSKFHWIRYDDEKFDRVFAARMAAQRGTDLHKFAMDAIRLGVRLPETPLTTMSLYVNDCIGYRMTPEQPLYYSDNAFGTPDAISFRNETLRIFDLKTGKIKASVEQLEVYSALFCLEYLINPNDIDIDLRIYQNDEAALFEGDPSVVLDIMEKIRKFDKRLNELREEVSW